MTPEEIGALAAYFTGPNVAQNSIGLEMPARASDARHFFEVRKGLGIEGYCTLMEGAKQIRLKLQHGDQLADACKMAGIVPTNPHRQAVVRAVELLKLVSAFVEQNGYETGALTYDEADCDGLCFATDCGTAAEELAARFGVPK